MNRKYGIASGLLLVVLMITLLFNGCKSCSTTEPVNDLNVDVSKDNTELVDDINKAKQIFQAIPSPLESAMLIKSTGAKFNQTLLNPLGNADSYATSRSMALNLGVYTCDLSFTSLYEQTQLIIDYMNASKKMAEGLGILRAIDQATIDRLEQNINNTEVIMEIVSETFMNSSSDLVDNGQPAVAAMVLVGGWFEGLYIATQLVDMKDFNGNKLVGRIIDQKLSIDILLNLLDENKGNPAIDELIIQVQKLKAVFDKINLTTSPIRPEYVETTNTTYLKSEVKSNLTPEVFAELAKTVAEIRGTFVK
ncbi:MAG: hypothetical protein MUD02_01570 [Bacteroidales bacterium]|jgi:hypothetical protein|nr:hypothetical protein [Bacteroidales bacterium]MCU0407612.1 hypothetical protein [Bacteroidales bacterium]